MRAWITGAALPPSPEKSRRVFSPLMSRYAMPCGQWRRGARWREAQGIDNGRRRHAETVQSNTYGKQRRRAWAGSEARLLDFERGGDIRAGWGCRSTAAYIAVRSGGSEFHSRTLSCAKEKAEVSWRKRYKAVSSSMRPFVLM